VTRSALCRLVTACPGLLVLVRDLERRRPSARSGVHTVAADWSAVFRRSTVHPAVFSIRDPGAAAALIDWAGGYGLAHDHHAYLLSAELDGWALLDGGLSYLQAHMHGRLRSGLRVVGWLSLRLLAAEIGVVAPRRLLVGEPAGRDRPALSLLAEQGWLTHPPATAQAGLLVSYVDANGLREVADQLVGPTLQD